MKNRLLFFISFICCCYLNGQVFVYELPEMIEEAIESGSDCLQNDEYNCDSYFQKALSEAKKVATDSILAMTYFEICTAHDYYGSSTERIRYAYEAINTTVAEEHPLITNRLYRELAYSYRQLKEMDSILPMYESALKWARYSKDNSTIAATYITMAGGYRQLGDIKKSIEILLKAKPYAEASGDIHRISGVTFNLAGAYSENRDDEQARVLYKEAAKGFLEAEDTAMHFSAVINGAMIRMDENYKTAIPNLERALEYYQPIDANSSVLIKTQLARAYSLSNRCEEAITLAKSNLEFSEKNEQEIRALLNVKILSRCYITTGRPSLALLYSERAYTAEKEGGISEGYLNAFQQHAEALKANGRFEEAIEVFDAWTHAKDTLFSRAKQSEIAELQQFYEAEKRDNQILLLEKEAKVSSLQKWLLASGALALLVLLTLVYFRFKERAKRAQREKEKVASELEFKKKELTSHALHLAKKNEVLLSLKQKVENVDSRAVDHRDILNTINFDLRDEENWTDFTQYFEQVHTDFSKNVQKKYPGVTTSELRLMALLKMNLTSKEIANMLNITSDGVKKARQRLRKKMDLSPEDSLEAEVLSL